MSETFPKGTKVKIGQKYTQAFVTMGKVFEVMYHRSTGMHTDVYEVRDGNGVAYTFMDHLLEETDEPLVVGATLFELLYAPPGTKAFSPRNDTVLRREGRGWVISHRPRKVLSQEPYPLSQAELANYMPVYLVGTWPEE